MSFILNKPLISVDELAELITNHDKLCILDCRHNMMAPEQSEQIFNQSHIPGAQFIHLDRELSGVANGKNGRHPLPEIEQMNAVFAAKGINSDSIVVAYDADGGALAARLWWTLRWLGHTNCYVLDGGFPAWSKAEKAISSEIFTPARGNFTAQAAKIWLSADEVSNRNNQTILIDARNPERFRGEIEPMGATPGHIPGAINRFFQLNLAANGLFKSPDILRGEFLNLLGYLSPSDSIHSCGSGVTACHNILAMEYAGLSGAKLYTGSWSEWSSDPQRPIELG